MDGIRVWFVCGQFAATVQRRSLNLLAELNEINQHGGTAHVYWNGVSVIVEQTLHADGLTDETLGQACLAVAVIADDIGLLLAAMFGGETPYLVMDDEAEDEEGAEEEEEEIR